MRKFYTYSPSSFRLSGMAKDPDGDFVRKKDFDSLYELVNLIAFNVGVVDSHSRENLVELIQDWQKMAKEVLE